jgi:AhpD family alkylhydroperoxidase
MENKAKEFFEKFKKDFGKMQKQVPDTISGFSGMFEKIMKDGALSVQQKELIALGIGVSQRCKPCIRLHTKKCLEAGATKEQILEAASVAVMMAGGPAYTHIPVVIDTLEALES